MSDKIIIDENIEETFRTLVENPSKLRTKDYIMNLPIDYANDFAFTLFLGAISYNAKRTIKYTLAQFKNEALGTNFKNEAFAKLYETAKHANPGCKNEFLPLFFAYVQLVGSETGLTEEENKELLGVFLNKIENDNAEAFPDKFYSESEGETMFKDESVKPSESFLQEVKEFYQNLTKNANAYFDEKVINSTLNQYLDDYYTITSFKENTDIEWFGRTDRVFEIEKLDLTKQDVNVKNKDGKVTLQSVLDAVNTQIKDFPIIDKDEKYDFSHIDSSIDVIVQYYEKLAYNYNKYSKNGLVAIPEFDLTDEANDRYQKLCKNFIATYVSALVSQKEGKNLDASDPYRLLDPNLRVNLIKANEMIYRTLLKENVAEDKIASCIKELVGISVKLANYVENTKMFTIPKPEKVDKDAISSKLVLKYILNYYSAQNKVYIKELNELEKIKKHLDDDKHYGKDQLAIELYGEKYLPGVKTEDLTVDKLLEVIDKTADKFFIGLRALEKRLGKISPMMQAYISPRTPDAVKVQLLKYMDNYIETSLAKERCASASPVFVKLIHDALLTLPVIKTEMQKVLDLNKPELKNEEAYKKAEADAFKKVCPTILSLNKDKCSTSYRFAEKTMTKSYIKKENKKEVKNYVSQALANLGHKLSDNGFADEGKQLLNLSSLFDINIEGNYISNGYINVKDKRSVKEALYTMYLSLDDNGKKLMMQERKVIVGLINKIPTNRDYAAEKLVEIVSKHNPKIAEELNEDMLFDLRFATQGDSEVKNKYRLLLPKSERAAFDKIWAELPTKSTKTARRMKMKAYLYQLIQNFDKETKVEYLNYFEAAFPTKNHAYFVDNAQYALTAKNKLSTLFAENGFEFEEDNENDENE